MDEFKKEIAYPSKQKYANLFDGTISLEEAGSIFCRDGEISRKDSQGFPKETTGTRKK